MARRVCCPHTLLGIVGRIGINLVVESPHKLDSKDCYLNNKGYLAMKNMKANGVCGCILVESKWASDTGPILN